jgi:hypothetical protein
MLTIQDLHETLADERHLGWGYAGRDRLAASKRDRLDRAVVAVANELGLDTETLFHWSNSKNGRWLIDEATDSAPTRDLVRKHLNPDAVASSLVLS